MDSLPMASTQSWFIVAAVATIMPMITATIAPKRPFQPKCATIVHAAIPPKPPQTTMPRRLPRIEPRWEGLMGGRQNRLPGAAPSQYKVPTSNGKDEAIQCASASMR